MGIQRLEGSRLFSRVLPRLVIRRNLRGWPDTLQSGSPPGSVQSPVASTHYSFEDENERRHRLTPALPPRAP